MNIRILPALIVSLVAALVIYLYMNDSTATSEGYFSEVRVPIEQLTRVYDIGVSDINQDGLLDIYTANHNFLNSILVNEGNGHFSDGELGEIGLSQVSGLPGLEPTFVEPDFNQHGIYIYWIGDFVHVRYLDSPSLKKVHGTLHSFSRTSVRDRKTEVLYSEDPGDSEVEVETTEITERYWQSNVRFSFNGTGHVVMKPALRDTPITLNFPEHIPLTNIFVGRLAVHPQSHTFNINLQDRHGYAWGDFNADGLLDTYVSRGGSNGRIAKLPEEKRRLISDELLIQDQKGGYANRAFELGVTKNICSGRKVAAIDYDRDNKLDIYVNCLFRGFSPRKVSKQLFRQGSDGLFSDVADDVGLGLPDIQFQSQIWVDVDNDSDLDLVATSGNRILLIRNDDGQFEQQLIAEVAHEEIPLNSKLRIANEWQFDRKLTAADFDADGDIDIFMSSHSGNALLVNKNGDLQLHEASKYGLPDDGVGASWVDYDNDGLIDLHIIPDGLFKQESDGGFVRAMRIDAAKEDQYAAIANWFDMDNDGDADVVMALDQRPSLFQDKGEWYERPWKMVALANEGSNNHWLQLEVIGPAGNLQAYGSQIFVKAEGRTQYQQVGLHDGAYFSQGHYRLYFGLGDSNRIDSILVKWLDGSTQELRNVPVDQIIKVTYAQQEAEQESVGMKTVTGDNSAR